MPAAAPGLVFRVLEHDAARPAFRRAAAPDLPAEPSQTFIAELSGPPLVSDLRPWRVLRFKPQTAADTDADAAAYAKRIAPLLSRRLNQRVFLLHMVQGGAVWSLWDNGEDAERSPLAPPAPPFWSRLLHFRRTERDTERDTEAWALQRGLPLRGLMSTAKSKRRTVDYDAVAGLERKGLLIENAPVWYRFPVS